MSLNRFGPFDADVWGSVSDWVMIAVTALTAILLYITLKLQARNSREQTALFEIEQKRYLKQLLPRIEFKTKGNPLVPLIFIVDVIIQDNPVYNLEIKIKASEEIEFFDIPEGKKMVVERLNIGVGISFSFKINIINITEDQLKKLNIKFDFTFEDELGVKYQQEAASFGLKTFASIPPKRI